MQIVNNHHFHFFRNRELDSLYFALALIGFGEGLVSIFVPIYLYEIGYPIWRITLYFFLIALSFVTIALTGAPIIKRLNDKVMMLLALPFLITYFVGLRFIPNLPILYFLLPAVIATGSLLFNAGYHISFSGACDKKDTGKEVGMRTMISQLVSFSSPFVGGTIIAANGFRGIFFISATFLLVAILPLLFFKKRGFASTFSAKKVISFLKNKDLRPFYLSDVGYALESHVGGILWPLFIFIAIGEARNFGGVISIALLIGAIATFLLGMISDHGQRKKIILISAVLLSATYMSRLFVEGATAVSLSHFGGSMIYSVLIVAWSSQFYRISKSVSDHSTYILSYEVLNNLTRICFFPFVMLLAYYLPQHVFFRVAFVIAAGVTLLFLFSNKQKDVSGKVC